MMTAQASLDVALQPLVHLLVFAAIMFAFMCLLGFAHDLIRWQRRGGYLRDVPIPEPEPEPEPELEPEPEPERSVYGLTIGSRTWEFTRHRTHNHMHVSVTGRRGMPVLHTRPRSNVQDTT